MVLIDYEIGRWKSAINNTKENKNKLPGNKSNWQSWNKVIHTSQTKNKNK